MCCAGWQSFSEMSKPKLIDIAEVSETNHRVIVQFVNNVNNAMCKDSFNNFRVLITDAATYMIKAGAIFKETFDYLRHVTCLASNC